MTAVNFLMSKQNENHSEIRIAFTTDEEIGRGVHKNLPDDLNVKFAYTFDGGKVGEIDNETFSADSAEVLIKGVSIHPGDAKNEMVNAIHLASEIINNLPLKTMTPEVTENREGFIHATDMIGNSSEMRIKFILIVLSKLKCCLCLNLYISLKKNIKQITRKYSKNCS